MRGVLGGYGVVLGLPGALAFSSAGLLGRLELSMVGLGSVLLVQQATDSWGIGGAVAAVLGVVSGVAEPVIARFADRYGQAPVLRLVIVVHVLALVGLVAVPAVGGPVWLLFVMAAVVGATQMNVGAFVRARWGALVGGTDRLQTAFAVEAVLDEFVFIVGPLVVTVLAAAVGPAAVLLLAAGLALGGVLALAAQHRTEPPLEGTGRAGAGTSGLVVRLRGMIVLTLVFAAVGAIFGSSEVAAVAAARSLGVPALAGVLLALFATSSMVSGIVYGSRRWRSRLDRRLAVLLVVLAVLTVPMVLVASIPLLAVAFFAAGAAIAPVLTTGTTLVEGLVPGRRLTEGLAWTSASLATAYALADAAGGAVIDAGGSRAGFLVTVGAACAAALVALVGLRRLRPQQRVPV